MGETTMNKDALGERMKQSYENRFRYMLPRRTYTMLRIDGKAFHTFTRGCTRPYDLTLMHAMDEAAKFLCEEIQGARLAYVQSDEISVLLADFDKITADAWFDGNLQKIVSVSASLATGAFNRVYQKGTAFFDSRAFAIADPIEVANYLIWRQQDAVRNSISMAAQSFYSPKELHGKNTSQQQEMIFQKGQNWNDYPAGFKRGRAIIKQSYEFQGELRTRWATGEPPIFTQDRDWLRSQIPIHPDFTQREEVPEEVQTT